MLDEPGPEVLLEPVGIGTIPVECEAVELVPWLFDPWLLDP